MYELQGTRWPTIIAPEMREDCIEWWRETRENGVYAEMEQVYLGMSGPFRVKVTAIPVFSADHSRLTGYVGTIERL